MEKPTDYKVVRTSSPPRYFQSLSDAADDVDQGLEDTKIVPLYEGPYLPKPRPEPTSNIEIQKKIAELQDEIMALSYKVLGDPTKSFTANVNPNGYDLSSTIFNPFSSGSSQVSNVNNN